MGDISIIARRLKNTNYIQHGWSGNGGYCSNVGLRLLEWYNTPEMVEYLFGLGELRLLWQPGSEHSDRLLRNRPTGTPHYIDTSEESMFSRIAFVEYAYFYDSDQQWYYVSPKTFRMKIPLTMVAQNLDDSGSEYACLGRVEQAILTEITEHWYESCPAFRTYLAKLGYDENAVRAMAKIKPDSPDDQWYPLQELKWQHQSLFRWFDEWVVVRPQADSVSIGEIVMQQKRKDHYETIGW